MNEKILFSKLPWNKKGFGVREKLYKRETKQIRIIEFSNGFHEEDWCTAGHKGYVLDGSFNIEFVDHIVEFEKGDGIWIEEGNTSKHKARITNGKVLLLLVEG